MTSFFDVIVIGAGPAGLMAAKTAAAQNLKVALIEKRKDIPSWTRADCMMLYGLEGGFLGEDIKVEVGKVIFPNNGFEVTYTGGLYPLFYKRIFSPGGHRIEFYGGDPISIVFDKGILLKDLLGEVEKLGVDLLTGTLGVRAENTPNGAKVLVNSQGQKNWLEAKKVIAADGINSRITQSIGLNDNRTYMGTLKVVQYIMEGVDIPYPNSWMMFYGKSLSPLVPLHFQQTVCGEKLHKLGAVRPSPGNPEQYLKNLMQNSYYASWFKNARIVSKMGTAFKAFMPIKRPIMGNILVIGDAADSGEVENQGALMCGYHAGHAVSKEIEGKNGMDEYCNWWQKSFEFFSPDINRVAQGFAINPHYDDREIDYLFSLVEGETLEGTIIQYKTPRILWDAILRHKDRIRKEQPELSRKIEKIHQMTVEEAFAVDKGRAKQNP